MGISYSNTPHLGTKCLGKFLYPHVASSKTKHQDANCIQTSYKPSPAIMPRARVEKRKAPKTCDAKRHVTKKKSNPAYRCSEDCDLFSYQNIDNILEDESGQLPMSPQHSKEIFPCSNAAAHRDGPHYTCTSCSSLSNTHLRNTPNALLYGGHPSIHGQRFFPLCVRCTQAARTSANQGCICLQRTFCFQCKCDRLKSAAAKRDAEVERTRLGFVPCGEKVDDKWLSVRPILKCLCGHEKVEVGDGKEGILRCAGCEGTVTKTNGRVWDPFARDFVIAFG